MPHWLAENFPEVRIDGSFQPGLSHPARTLEPLFPAELCVCVWGTLIAKDSDG